MIAAEGEQKASRALREASEMIAESPSALQLRYLQVTLGEPDRFWSLFEMIREKLGRLRKQYLKIPHQ